MTDKKKEPLAEPSQAEKDEAARAAAKEQARLLRTGEKLTL